MLLQHQACNAGSSRSQAVQRSDPTCLAQQQRRRRRQQRHSNCCVVAAAAAAGPAAADDSSFTAEQLAFLERKRRFKAGTGPAMPLGSICKSCSGEGVVVCWECKGTGVNSRDVEQIMGSSMEQVRQQNGVLDVRWFLMRNGPCWICRGKPTCPCRDCEGTGITGFDLSQFCGD